MHMEAGAYSEDRKHREREFHDDAFARNARQSAWKYYAVTVRCRQRYTELITAYGAGKRILEYGCGQDSNAKVLAAHGAQVTSIDISSTAVEKARARAEELGLADHMTFQVLRIHHLDLTLAYTEIARVLVPEGRAVFTEPLGSNKLINRYRRHTPHLRTVDEHPLLPR